MLWSLHNKPKTKQAYAAQLIDWIKESQFKQVLVLAGASFPGLNPTRYVESMEQLQL
jgi:hypothetical protein